MTASQLDVGAARPVTVAAGDRPLAALQAGAPDAPPVLMVPGYTGSKEDFGPVLAPIAAAGYLVTAIDLPGQFESPGSSTPSDYTPDRLGAVVVALARGLGRPVRLLGHSFGGLVARAAAIARPDVFTSLVLLSSGPSEIGGMRRQTMEALEPVLAEHGLPGVYAALQSAALADPDYVAPPPELADFLERRFLAGAPAMLQGMSDALRREPDRVAELAATGLRTLVLHGADDDAWPPAVQREMAGRLSAEYAVIAAAAHSAAVENPSGLVEALLTFWGQPDATD